MAAPYSTSQVEGRVTPPTDAEIFDKPTAAAHPHQILSAPDLASAVREGYEQAGHYRQIAHALLDALHHTIAERDQLRARLRERA